jgi:TM2 domain-containing membrane protein YozV
MYCRSCDTQLVDGAIACVNCGMAPLAGDRFCSNCGGPTNPGAIACVTCGLGLRPVTGSNNKVAAGLCGILLGALGVHKFVLGYTSAGIVMLLITVLTCGYGGIVTGIIGLIEGIVYLTKSDAEFHQMYVVNKKQWF